MALHGSVRNHHLDSYLEVLQIQAEGKISWKPMLPFLNSPFQTVPRASSPSYPIAHVMLCLGSGISARAETRSVSHAWEPGRNLFLGCNSFVSKLWNAPYLPRAITWGQMIQRLWILACSQQTQVQCPTLHMVPLPLPGMTSEHRTRNRPWVIGSGLLLHRKNEVLGSYSMSSWNQDVP